MKPIKKFKTRRSTESKRASRTTLRMLNAQRFQHWNPQKYWLGIQILLKILFLTQEMT